MERCKHEISNLTEYSQLALERNEILHCIFLLRFSSIYFSINSFFRLITLFVPQWGFILKGHQPYLIMGENRKMQRPIPNFNTKFRMADCLYTFFDLKPFNNFSSSTDFYILKNREGKISSTIHLSKTDKY